jgi:hypothetical protein
MAKAPNYSPEELEQLKDWYNQTGKNLTTEQFEDAVKENFPGRTVRSVRSKLVREGDYIVPEKEKKEKRNGPTKKELLKQLCDLTGLSHKGLDPATKESIQELITLVSELKKG